MARLYPVAKQELLAERHGPREGRGDAGGPGRGDSHGPQRRHTPITKSSRLRCCRTTKRRGGCRRDEAIGKKDIVAARTRCSPDEAGLPIVASILLPAVQNVLAGRVRTQPATSPALQAIEALRMHAAANGGKLPA